MSRIYAGFLTRDLHPAWRGIINYIYRSVRTSVNSSAAPRHILSPSAEGRADSLSPAAYMAVWELLGDEGDITAADGVLTPSLLLNTPRWTFESPNR
jgi:hypothetical protein